MPWDPERYDQFKTARQQPFADLASHIAEKPEMKIIDLGCGTGELTHLLANKFSGSAVKGIDASPEMLVQAGQYKNCTFENKTIEEQVASGEKWDLIFSNAALQWLDDHEKLMPAIISCLNNGGQLAVQMPSQNENVLNRILYDLAAEDTYQNLLERHIKKPSLLSLDAYAGILFKNSARHIVVYQKVYPLIVNSAEQLFDLISGTALLPYIEVLKGDMQSSFLSELRLRIDKTFAVMPALYAFKRIILYGQF